MVKFWKSPSFAIFNWSIDLRSFVHNKIKVSKDKVLNFIQIKIELHWNKVKKVLEIDEDYEGMNSVIYYHKESELCLIDIETLFVKIRLW